MNISKPVLSDKISDKAIFLFRFTILSSCIISFLASSLNAQTPGFIFEPSVGNQSVFDPNSDGLVSISPFGFSNDGYEVDEFEIPMYSLPILGDGEVTGDLSSGPSCGFTDMSFDTAGTAVFIGIDGSNNVIFRYRLAGSAPNAKGYSILIDSDGLFGVDDTNATSENPGFEIAITLITKHGVDIYDIDGVDNCADLKQTFAGQTHYQKAFTIVGPCGDQDVFYDFFIPLSALTTHFGITGSTPLRFVGTTNTSASCALEGSLSDVGGVDDDAYGGCVPCMFEDLITSVPPIPLDSLCATCSGFPPSYSDCPAIAQPVADASTSFSGTSEASAIIYYSIYNSIGTLLSSDSTVADTVGSWVSNTVSPALVSGDSIVVGALTPGKSLISNCSYALVGANCTNPLLTGASVTIDQKGICGSAGNGISGAIINVYKDGILLNPGTGTPAPVTVAGDGSWIWKCNSNTGCNGGTNCVANGVYFITQTVPGECESAPIVLCYNTTGTAATPVINEPVSSEKDTVSGTATALATIYIYINGVYSTSTTADGSGNWFLANAGLAKCDSVSARAVSGTLCISPYSSSAIVQESGDVPTLNCNLSFGSTGVSGNATGEQFDSVFVYVYDVSSSTLLVDTTNLSAFNNYTHTLNQFLDVGDSVKVKYRPTCGTLSGFSLTCIVPDTVQRPTVDCSLNYSANDSIIVGNHPVNGLTISVYIDGSYLDTTTVAGGAWTLVASQGDLYTGAVITAIADNGAISSPISNSCTVSCVLPIDTFTLSYSGAVVDSGDYAILNLSGSQSSVFYELYNVLTSDPIGNTLFGNDSIINLNTFPLSDTVSVAVRAFKLPPVCESFLMDTIQIDVNFLTNSAPIANDTIVFVNEDSPTSICITIYDPDLISGDSLTCSIIDSTNNGVLVIDSLGCFTYTPSTNFFGTDTVIKSVCDLAGLCDTASIIITVNSINDTPVAVDDTAPTNEDNPVLIDPLINDTDVEGPLDSTSVTVIGGPSNGGTAVDPITGAITYTPTANWFGVDTITYVVCDLGIPVLCDTALIVFTVNSVNDAPIIMDDTISTNEDNPVVLDPLANDSDIEGPLDSTSVTIIGGPSNGGTAVDPITGAITYTPNANYNGVDTVTYVVCDLGVPVLCDTALIVFTVNSVNDAPIAMDDTASTNEDIPVLIDPLANDTDVEGPLDSTSVTVIGGPSNGGTAVDPITGAITYTPTANWFGVDTITYVVCDLGIPVLCDTALIVFTVNSVNDAPIIMDDTISTNEDNPVVLDPLANDSDIEGPLDSTSVTVIGGPSNGGVVVDSVTGAITYTPNANWFGIDTVTYVVCDLGAPVLCDTAQIVFTVNSVNDAPIAVNDTASTNEDNTVIIDPLLNDTDIEGPLDSTSVTVIGGPSNGGAVVDPVTGAITYTPNTNWYGVDTITYTVCDLGIPVLCDTASIIVTVNSVNDGPVVLNDTASTNEDIPVVIDPLINDTDIEGPLDSTSVTVIGGPSNGGAAVDPITGAITYTPNANWFGVDTITYVVCDLGVPVLCDTAQIVFTVNSVNDAPIAMDDTASTNEDNTVIIDPLLNDTDIEGPLDSTSVTVIGGPSNGGAVVDPITGAITYTPNANWFGIDTVTYVVCDLGAPVLCDTAQIVFTVNSVNDAPIAMDDTASTNEDNPVVIDPLANDTDIEGPLDSTSVTVIGGPSNGGTAVDPITGAITYTPNANWFGIDTLTYVVCDLGVPVLCDTASIIVTVNSVNDAPIAMDDTASTNEDNPVVIDPLINDTDIEGPLDSTSVTVIGGPSNGGVVVDSVTGAITYTPNANWFGIDTVTYVVCDLGAPVLCDTAQIVFTVNSVNDAPIAMDDTASTNEDNPVVIDPLNNDSDIEGPLDSTSVTVIGGPSNGGTAVDPITGAITYTPNANWFGIDTLTYVVCDLGVPVLCDTASIIVTVNSVNDAPIAMDDTASTNEDIPVVIDPLANDSDIEGPLDSTSVTVIGGPSNGGTAVDPITGAITYTPNANWFGIDTVTYVVCDLGAPVLCDTAQIVFTVNSVNDAPIAIDDTASTNEDIPVVIDPLANDSDIEGPLDSTSVTVIGGPSNGGAVVDPVTGAVTYTPNLNWNGIDTMTYVVCDMGIPVLCDTAEIVITVYPVNNIPVALDDSTSTNEDNAVLVDPLANDSDIEGPLDSTSVTVIGGPSNGGAVVDPITGAITYTPNANWFGVDTITYVVCDLGMPVLCDTALIVFTVNSVNDAPIAIDDTASTNEDNPLVIDPLVNDTDIEGPLDSTSVTVIGGPSNGGAVVDPITGVVTYTPDPNWYGNDTITYVVCDLGAPALCDTANIIVTVNGVNDAPIALDNTVFTNEDIPVVIDPLANDSDIEGPLDSTSVTVIGGPSNGAAVVDPITGVVTYTPDPNWNGTDTLTYTVCDLGIPVLCDTALIIVYVNPVNDAPVANNDYASISEDTPIKIDPLINDTDIEGPLDSTTVTIISSPLHGTVLIHPVYGEVTYAPDSNWFGVDTMTYIVCDLGIPVLCDTAQIIITVNSVNDAPIAMDDTASTNEDTPLVIDPLINDTDIEGPLDSTSVTVIGGPSNGGAVVDPITGAITYTPNANWFGVDTITYVVCDLGVPVLCDTASIILTVNSVNDAPIAVNDTASTNEDTPIVIDPLANDTDIEGPLDSTSVTIIGGPSNGGAAVDPITGAITYTPNANWFGIDTVTYVVCDLGVPVLCDTASIIVTVNSVNDAPIAIDDTASTNEDTPVVIDPLINDTDIEGPLDSTSVTVIGGPSNGSAVVDPVTGAITYTPNANWFGVDTITYVVCDLGVPVLCDTALIVFTVNSVNDGPVAIDDTASTDEDTPVVIDPLINDTDIEGPLDSTSVTVIGGPSNGGAVVDPITGAITYTPNANWFGVDTITYVVCDLGVPVLCDTASIIVTVNSVNDAPIAVDDSASTNEDTPVVVDPLLNDTDIEGPLDSTSVTIIGGSSNGGAVVDPITGAITYTPNANWFGVDTITYVVCDLGVPVLCDTASIIVTVNSVNDAPIAIDDSASTNEDIPVVIDPLANDTDIEGPLDSTSVTIIGGPSNGGAVVDPITGAITYTPNANWFGVDTITYLVCDLGVPVLCDTAQIVFTVNSVNDAPIAIDDTASTNEDTPVVIDPLINDTDIEGPLDSTSVTVIGGPSNGGAAVDPITGAITYTPNANWFGIDTVTYVVCDLGVPVLCDTASIIVTVNSVNDAPIAIDDTASTNEDTPVVIDPLINDTDIEGPLDSTSVTVIGGPSNGGAVVDPVTGAITYTPNANWFGVDTITYVVCDLGVPVLCDTAQIVFTVNSVNDAPIAVDDTASTNEDNPVIIDPLANDSDIEGPLDSTSVTVIGGPSNGGAVVDPVTGAITYTPNANWFGIDTLTYVVCDQGVPVLCDTAQIVLTVNSVNDAPIAVDDMASTNEDIPVVIDPLANDTDIEAPLDSTSVTIIGSPSNGGAVVDPVTGAITYTPNANWFGVDTITYVVCDLGVPVLCDTALIVFTVNSVNDGPVAIDDTASTDEDTPLVVAVVNNDYDIENGLDTLSIVIIGGPFHGTAMVDPITGSIIYVPDADYNGLDSLYYIICDKGVPVLCDTAVLVITVNPVNDAPIAVDDYLSTPEDTPITFNPLVNDIDVENGLDSTSVTIIAGPINGTAMIDPVSGAITYVPNPFFNGIDTITYVVCDLGMPVLCDTATIYITVIPVNNPPIAVNDTVTTNEDTPIDIVVLINDTDVDGNIDSTTVMVIDPPQNGIITIDPVTGVINYTPVPNFFGTDTFTYVICDMGTPVYCDTATVIVTILSVNDPPVAINDTVNLEFGHSLEFPVDTNDYDIDGIVDPASVMIIGGPANGTANVDPFTGVITYNPNPTFYGTDSIIYVICDNGSPILCDTAVAYIIIVKPNEPNIFIPDAFSPNGDNIYDLFVINLIENYPNNILRIFNRWGNLVYEKNGYDNSWDGTTNSGIVVYGDGLPDGTYFYVLDIKDENFQKAGFVVIKRE